MTATAGVGASADAIQHHYDVGNDFYALWLDPTLTYSCALYESEESSLEEAQLAKLRYWVDQLRIGPGARVLDVGCGWGGMLAAVLDAVPDASVLGLTLSAAQRDHVEGRGVPVSLTSWEDFEPADPFDAIVSIGAFEHFARDGISRRDRIERYRAFFERCFSWLPADGRLCLQTIALEDAAEDADSRAARYILDQVFPESSLPRLAEVAEAAGECFRLAALRVDGDHYARTCREWRRRLHANREAAIALVGTETVKHYSRYLFLAENQFVTRGSTLYRFTFERRPERVPTDRA